VEKIYHRHNDQKRRYQTAKFTQHFMMGKLLEITQEIVLYQAQYRVMEDIDTV
jgi:hypothetical protein